MSDMETIGFDIKKKYNMWVNNGNIGNNKDGRNSENLKSTHPLHQPVKFDSLIRFGGQKSYPLTAYPLIHFD